MKLINIVTVPMMSLLLLACGGGGGDSASTNATPAVEKVTAPIVEPTVDPVVFSVPEPTEDPVVEVELEPDPNAVYESTAELVAARKFLFNHDYELAVSYKNEPNRSAYLSVCSEFTEGDAIKVNYKSCLLGTSVEASYAGTLSVPNDKNRLVMAIWYFDDVNNPRYEIWENDNDASTLSAFNVN
jgi:hypothetical protein